MRWIKQRVRGENDSSWDNSPNWVFTFTIDKYYYPSDRAHTFIGKTEWNG